MNIDTSDRRQLERASNVLLLAPLTPTGNRACLELLTATTPPEQTNVAAVTYTPPPETWISDWNAHMETLPAELAFIHANKVQTDADETNTEALPPDTTVARVDPNQPMDIIAPLSEQLTRWQTNDDQAVISVQTLSILLEYVDFDTAFRYLHILTHRVQSADAVGYYHMDPDIHDAETVNTLKTLFDAVVEVSADEDEWSVKETYGDRSATSDHAQSHETETAGDDSDGGLFSAVRNSLTGLFSSSSESDDANTAETAGDESDSTVGSPPTNAPAAGNDDVSGPDSEFSDLPEDAMLTDEDRIRELLTQYGGRMKQTDVTDETDWSKSTVSRKLSKMEDKGLITRVQVGRGNLVFLSGYEPESTKSPFEKELD
ncbi:helix-turn-helix transcriptional regulator [Halorussus halophilus]|uniref:helix-turn-helix transcriptional regulator n=1 Tax=Halorussus halophilus TaxID=2650975 RepID=UPI001301069A|nr:MarR family transcriptional regulator [Halorussus halophilus]